MNKIILIGNVGSVQEMKTTQSGVEVGGFSLAVKGNQKDENGEYIAEWFKITAWRKLAELCDKYVSKGHKVAVVGSVALKLYTKSDGSPGASMEVTADSVEFLTPRGTSTYNDNDNPVPAQSKSDFIRVDDEELPF